MDQSHPSDHEMRQQIRDWSVELDNSELLPIEADGHLGSLQPGEGVTARLFRRDGSGLVEHGIKIERISEVPIDFELTAADLPINIVPLSLIAGEFVSTPCEFKRAVRIRSPAVNGAGAGAARAAAASALDNRRATIKGLLDFPSGSVGEFTYDTHDGHLDLVLGVHDTELSAILVVAELRRLPASSSAIQTRIITCQQRANQSTESVFKGSTRFNLSDPQLLESYDLVIRSLEVKDACLFDTRQRLTFEANADFIPIILQSSQQGRFRFSSRSCVQPFLDNACSWMLRARRRGGGT